MEHEQKMKVRMGRQIRGHYHVLLEFTSCAMEVYSALNVFGTL